MFHKSKKKYFTKVRNKKGIFVLFVYFCTMQNIFSHIAYLLVKHECVIIPGFGALVHSVVSSKEAIDGDVFSPPCVSLGFNSELKHNDGLLADSVRREQNISYNEANRVISEFSTEFSKILKSGGEVTIPRVGRFTLSKDNKINFSPAADLSANAVQYGFKNFYLPLLSEIAVPVVEEEVAKNKGKDVIMIPLSKRLLSVASVAAVVLVLLLFSTPIANKEIPTQYAGMFSAYVPETAFVDFSESAMNKEEVTEDTIITTNVEIIDDLEPVVLEQDTIPEVKPAIVKSETLLTPAPAINKSDDYLIVIASFPSRSEANRMLSLYKKDFSKASIIEKNDRSRIFIRSFEDKAEAEYFLNKFRIDNPKYKDAWLLSNKKS